MTYTGSLVRGARKVLISMAAAGGAILITVGTVWSVSVGLVLVYVSTAVSFVSGRQT